MSLLTDEEVKEIRLSVPAVCTHADLIRHTEKFIEAKFEQGKRDAVPEGWVAIPIIPTDKQIRAMEDQWMRGSNMDMAMREYRSAIAAAPKQEN